MSTGTLYYHLDGLSLPGPVAPRLKRRRDIAGQALKAMPSKNRRRLVARLWRAAEQQARKIEMHLMLNFQYKERRVEDIQALRELTRILRELSVVEDCAYRTAGRERGGVEHTQALAVEGRAVYISRTKRR